jgi:hypothetical protein
MGMQYGAMVRVLINQVTYVVIELGPEDLPQLGDPGMEGYTVASISSIRGLAIIARARRRLEGYVTHVQSFQLYFIEDHHGLPIAY